MVTVSGNPNPTYPTNPTTKYRCEFVNLFCIYAGLALLFVAGIDIAHKAIFTLRCCLLACFCFLPVGDRGSSRSTPPTFCM